MWRGGVGAFCFAYFDIEKTIHIHFELSILSQFLKIMPQEEVSCEERRKIER